MTFPAWTPEDIAELEGMYRDGWEYLDMSYAFDKYDVYPDTELGRKQRRATICMALRRFGIFDRQGYRKRISTIHKFRAQALQMSRDRHGPVTHPARRTT